MLGMPLFLVSLFYNFLICYSLTCNGGNPNNCLDCSPTSNRNWNSGTHECNCTDGYYNING